MPAARRSRRDVTEDWEQLRMPVMAPANAKVDGIIAGGGMGRRLR